MKTMLLVVTGVLLPVIGVAAVEAPGLTAVADHPIVTLIPEGAKVILSLRPKPTGAVQWQQVPDRLNPLRTSGTAVLVGTGAQVTATLPAAGVYQFRAETTGPTGEVRRATTWVQVWDDRTVLHPGAALGTNPATLPPTSVRTLSPTPVASVHPRVLFTATDWPEMRQRATTGKVAGWGVATLRAWVAETFDQPKEPCGSFVRALDAWGQGSGELPDLKPLAADSILASEGRGNFSAMLLAACYLAWLEHEPNVALARMPPPMQQRRVWLARVLAAASKAYLAAIWDRSSGTAATGGPLIMKDLGERGEAVGGPGLCELALAYDFAYPWMDDAQRQSARDLFAAVSWGRHTSGIGFSWPTAERVAPGMGHNGDFGNLNEQHILCALAIEGEEAAVSPWVREAFMTPPADRRAARWMSAAPADDVCAWPTATIASVENLERELRWITDWFITPWGMAANHLAYLGLTGRNMLPATLALARRGENLFVTTHLYQVGMHVLQSLHPNQGPTRNDLATTMLGWWDHHDGGSFGQRGTVPILLKYMYPDDPLIELMWQAYLPTLSGDPLVAAWFGLDPARPVEMAAVAAAKRIPTTLFDPQRSIVTLRSDWSDQGLSVWFDCGADAYAGHMHAEKNSFDLFALGRPWSIAPGYHVTPNDFQATVLIKDPRVADDPASGGFIGQSPSSATQLKPFTGNHPTPPGRMLEVREAPDHGWALVAGDATTCYGYAYHGSRALVVPQPLRDWYYPGTIERLTGMVPEIGPGFSENLTVSTVYNPMRYAVRTLLLVRGSNPFVLVVDDIRKDDDAHDWRWSMNCAQGFGAGGSNAFLDDQGRGTYSTLAIQPGTTITDAVLYHAPIDAGTRAGLPRLLVRDLGLDPATKVAQPRIVLESRPPGGKGPYLTYGFDNNFATAEAVKVPSNRLLIERRGMASPGYVVLLYPFRQGQRPPATTWNRERTELVVATDAGSTTIGFDRTQPDHRTRLAVRRKP